MANLPESFASWVEGIYQLELTDPVVGGVPNEGTGAGMSNIPHQQLAKRTSYLKAEVEKRPLSTAFENLLESSGYQKLPGGLILQWAPFATVAGRAALTFPIPFPNACLGITGSHTGGGGAMFIIDVVTGPVTKTGFHAAISHMGTVVSNSSYSGYYLAWGH